jgi:hypothetical protein
LREAILSRLHEWIKEERLKGTMSGDSRSLTDRIKRWYRRMTLKHHPDQGGSEAVMKAINDVYEELNSMSD